jgi:hypothetical protein
MKSRSRQPENSVAKPSPTIGMDSTAFNVSPVPLSSAKGLAQETAHADWVEMADFKGKPLNPRNHITFDSAVLLPIAQNLPQTLL